MVLYVLLASGISHDFNCFSKFNLLGIYIEREYLLLVASECHLQLGPGRSQELRALTSSPMWGEWYQLQLPLSPPRMQISRELTQDSSQDTPIFCMTFYQTPIKYIEQFFFCVCGGHITQDKVIDSIRL